MKTYLIRLTEEEQVKLKAVLRYFGFRDFQLYVRTRLNEQWMKIS